MAGDWIAIRVGLPEEPEVINIAAAVGMDEFAAAGRLSAIWGWADRVSRDGFVTVSGDWIDRFVRCDGFASAMVKERWLAVVNGGLQFPNFERWRPTSGKERASAAAARQRLTRARKRVMCDLSRDSHCDPPKRIANKVLDRDGFTCVYCGSKEGDFGAGKQRTRIALDMIQPRQLGGKKSMENIVTACTDCITRKGHRSAADAQMPLTFLKPGVTVTVTRTSRESFRDKPSTEQNNTPLSGESPTVGNNGRDPACTEAVEITRVGDSPAEVPSPAPTAGGLDVQPAAPTGGADPDEPEKPPKETWITPFGAPHRERFQGVVPWPMLCKVIAPVVEDIVKQEEVSVQLARARALKRWSNFLDTLDPKRPANLHVFTGTHGLYDQVRRAPHTRQSFASDRTVDAIRTVQDRNRSGGTP